MITARQIKIIHVLKSRVGLSDDEYRWLLKKNFNVESSKDLSFEDAKQLVHSFVKFAGQIGVIQSNDPPGMATIKQQNMLRAIWKTVSFLPAGEQAAGLDSFIRNRFGVGCLRWLPKEMVGKVKHTLMAMQKPKECTNVG